MATQHDMQAQRFELKFIVPRTLRLPIRDFVTSYLELDSNAGEDFSYPIHSIYLDSPSLQTYHATLNGDRNRFKLRVRYYDDKPTSPVFLETKRKINDIVHKQRCMVPREVLHAAMAGDTGGIRSKDLGAHASIVQQLHQSSATPRAHVAYMREAWVSRTDNSVRVTMDSEVRVEPCFSLALSTSMKRPVIVFGDEIVLELKFTSRYPEWFREMVHTFHIVQGGAAKYSGGVHLYGEQHFHHQHSELEYV
jgi:SPX domain protein involved in polyphosphate accumulation